MRLSIDCNQIYDSVLGSSYHIIDLSLGVIVCHVVVFPCGGLYHRRLELYTDPRFPLKPSHCLALRSN